MIGGIDVAIVGVGPYGLSIAAHLGELGIDFRIFGVPMHNWLRHMPKRMLLKSEGFASSLYDPHGRFPLRRYCAEQGIGYADVGLPVPLEVFTAYGLAFSSRYVSGVEKKTVLSLKKLRDDKFLLSLDNGEEIVARNIVIATGFSYLSYIPKELTSLPKALLTHSAEHRDLEKFRGREVTVIGAGSSAIDLATLLHEGGVEVTIVSRKPRIEIDTKMQLPRPLLDRLRWPVTGAGLSWRSVIYANAPQIFRLAPAKLRFRIVKNHLGPTGGYFMRERFRHVTSMTGYAPVQTAVSNGRVRITFEGHGSTRDILADHVIAATGFRVDLRRLPFLSVEILKRLETIQQTPVLSSTFQSSIPGLYFVGLLSAYSFGPIMRFAYGARFAAPRIAGVLAETLVRGRKTR